MSGGKALRLFYDNFTEFERGEILDYNQVYYLGFNTEKIQASTLERYNNGYDDENGNYQIITKDHISYRYEIIELLGKGSFGQVVKCLDHKNNEVVAIKVIKNKKQFHQQAAIEARLLRYIRINDVDNKSNIVKFHENFLFRHHFVYLIITY